jgi:hypothetical protein
MKRIPVLLGLVVAIALLGKPVSSRAEPSGPHRKSVRSTTQEEAGANTVIPADSIVRTLLRAHDELPSTIWKRLLEVQNLDGTVLAHYLLFNLHGTFFSYSPDGGSRRIWPAGNSATALARAIKPGSLVTGVFFTPANVAASNQHFSLFW